MEHFWPTFSGTHTCGTRQTRDKYTQETCPSQHQLSSEISRRILSYRFKDAQEDSQDRKHLPTAYKANTEGGDAPSKAEERQPSMWSEFLKQHVARELKDDVADEENKY